MSKSAHLLWIELSRSALRHNICALGKLASGRSLTACIKSNAYGHGLGPIVTELADLPEVAYVTVHSLEEARAARDSGWDRRIMVLGPIAADALESVLELDLEPVVFDRGILRRLGKLGERRNCRVHTHLKLETGTNRQGINIKALPGFAEIYKSFRSLRRPYGASMHFANIEDTTVHEYAEYQLREFGRLLAALKQLGIKPEIRHAASSAATILFDKTRFDLVRPGISVYGHWPSKETYLSYRLAGGGNDLFRPVLSLKSRITQLKDLAPDTFVGYGCTYKTTARTKLAVVPIGYGDGYDRDLSNVAHVLVRGKRAPVRGRVCMNLTMVDVTHVKGVRLGDEVTLIGRDGDEVLTV